jgi:hypothetical protein
MLPTTRALHEWEWISGRVAELGLYRAGVRLHGRNAPAVGRRWAWLSVAKLYNHHPERSTARADNSRVLEMTPTRTLSRPKFSITHGKPSWGPLILACGTLALRDWWLSESYHPRLGTQPPGHRATLGQSVSSVRRHCSTVTVSMGCAKGKFI